VSRNPDTHDGKKQAHIAISNYREQIENTCQKINQTEDWSERLSLANDLGNQLTKIIENHGDILFDKTKSNLKDMLDFSDYYNRHSDTACSDLISKIKEVIIELEIQPEPKHASKQFPKKIITRVIIAIAVIVGIIVFYTGCGTCSVASIYWIYDESDTPYSYNSIGTIEVKDRDTDQQSIKVHVYSKHDQEGIYIQLEKDARSPDYYYGDVKFIRSQSNSASRMLQVDDSGGIFAIYGDNTTPFYWNEPTKPTQANFVAGR